jgi:16S rRNA processing protein RimM
MNPRFIPIARVVAPWGIHGEVKVESMTDFSDRFACGNTVYLQELPVKIESSRLNDNLVILKISTIDSRNQAEEIRGSFLEIPFSQLHSLEEGEYYQFQLLGLKVLSPESVLLGQISDIIQTGSNDVYEVSSDTNTFLIPATDEVIKSIDLAKGCMTIEVMKGLI